jgi:hypothetical protein
MTMSKGTDDHSERLRTDLRKLQTSINTAVASAPVEQVAVDRIYALLHNTKVQGEAFESNLVCNICALACGILQRTRSPDQGTWRIVKAHIDALAIVIEHNVAGDGGPLGQRMVEELKGLARAAGA